MSPYVWVTAFRKRHTWHYISEDSKTEGEKKWKLLIK